MQKQMKMLSYTYYTIPPYAKINFILKQKRLYAGPFRLFVTLEKSKFGGCSYGNISSLPPLKQNTILPRLKSIKK